MVFQSNQFLLVYIYFVFSDHAFFEFSDHTCHCLYDINYCENNVEYPDTQTLVLTLHYIRQALILLRNSVHMV
jgi:hypothetical protein